MSNAKGGRKELSEKAREGRRKGALIRNSGKHPLAGLPTEQRQTLLRKIMDRVIDGETITSIAGEIGVSEPALSVRLLQDCPDEWRSAQTARALVRLRRAEDEMDAAQDPLTVARTREQVRSAQWQLERLQRRLYGQDAPVQTGSGVTISIDLSSLQQAIDSKVNDQVD